MASHRAKDRTIGPATLGLVGGATALLLSGCGDGDVETAENPRELHSILTDEDEQLCPDPIFHEDRSESSGDYSRFVCDPYENNDLRMQGRVYENDWGIQEHFELEGSSDPVVAGGNWYVEVDADDTASSPDAAEAAEAVHSILGGDLVLPDEPPEETDSDEEEPSARSSSSAGPEASTEAAQSCTEFMGDPQLAESGNEDRPATDRVELFAVDPDASGAQSYDFENAVPGEAFLVADIRLGGDEPPPTPKRSFRATWGPSRSSMTVAMVPAKKPLRMRKSSDSMQAEATTYGRSPGMSPWGRVTCYSASTRRHIRSSR